MVRSVSGFAAALLLAVAVQAQQFSVGSLVIDDPWARPTHPGMPAGAAYLSITNRGAQEDTLLAARSPSAARVEFHRTSFESDMARMRPSGTLTIEPGKTLTAAPGGLHLMLVELREPLVEGTTIPLVLTFRNAGEVTVQVKVERREP